MKVGVCLASALLSCLGTASAIESSSPRYTNSSFSGIVAAAPTPISTPTPRPPASRPVWPWAALAAAALFAALRLRESRRDRAADETLALAAHELKSPLTAIESSLDLMTLEAPEGARDARRWLEDVQHMKSTAAHLRRTIADILDMTGIEDGRMKLAPRSVPLGPLLAGAAAAYEASARARGVGLVVEASPDAPAARADPDRLRQVLHNLIGNALKYTPSGRSVFLSARRDDARAAVAVRDEGIGVPPEKSGKLFGKFSRLAPSLDGSEGTGLGLYLSRRIIEASGGRLTYAPGPEGGSVFEFTLPRAEEGS